MRTILLSLTLILLSPSVFGQSITIGEDGIVRCKDIAIGTTEIIFGETYEVVDRDLLTQRINEGSNLETKCVSNIINMRGLFKKNYQFNSSISSWDVSNVNDMGQMFYQAYNFNQDISQWDVSNVVLMDEMFFRSKFNQSLNDWNVSKVQDMSGMFSGDQYSTAKYNQPLNNWDVSSVLYMNSMFRDNKDFNQPIGNWNTVSVKDMSWMFGTLRSNNDNASIFNQDISQWNVSNVTNMSYMFQAGNFNQPLNSWDVSNVIQMKGMFQRAINFDQPIEEWNVSKVIDMSFMFASSPKFNQPINNWDVTNLETTANMFASSPKFNQPLNSWDVSNVTDMGGMFNSSRFNQPLNNWDVSKVSNMNSMFNASIFNHDISSWCVILITNEPTRFSNILDEDFKPIWGTCPSAPSKIILKNPANNNLAVQLNDSLIWHKDLKSENYQLQIFNNQGTTLIDTITVDTVFSLSQWANPNSTYFWKVKGLANVEYDVWSDLWQFKTSSFSVDSNGIVYCYGATVGSTGLINEETYEVVDRDLLIQRRNEGADLSKTCVSNVSNMTGLFANVTFNQDISSWDVSNVTDMSGMFQNNSAFNQDLSKWNVDSVKTMTSMFQNSSFDQNIQDWNVSSVERMQKMFSGTEFNQPIGTWDVSSVIGMDEMFENSSFNQDISSWDVSSVGRMTNMFKGSDFNQPIGNWDVSNVYNMQGMFQKTSFNQDIGAWDVSKVTTMFGMFSENSSFNHDISSWDVSNVEAMVAMFFQNTAFNQDLGSWDVSNVKNMSSMFYLSGFNQDISNWDVSNVASMSNMFYGSPFNQNISNWCVILINSEPTNFSTDSPLALENKPIWGSCPAETPSQITLLSPSNNSSNVETRPYFSWDIDSLATKYELQLFNNQSIIIQDTLTDSTSLTLPFNLDLSSTYNWQVRGINDDKGLNGEWSELWSFTTKKVLLSAPTLNSPYNNQSNVGTMTEFYWNEVDSALFYHLQVSNDEQFSSIAFELTNITINSFLITTPLTENSIYFWRVKSISDDTLRNSDWSEMFSFTTGVRTSTEDEFIPEEYTLSQNYPNPFNPSTQIQYALPEATEVSLEVFNSVGQKVMELVNGQQPAGYHTATFDASGLSSGVYLYKLTTPSFTQTKKMLLIK